MNLLSSVYGLPKIGVSKPCERSLPSELGERWISFHHMLPGPELLHWLEAIQPFLITTIRHPGDVLISLYHHLHGFPSEPVDPLRLRKMLTEPFARVDIQPPALHTFTDELECSLAWIRLGKTRVVRYEDLRYETLRVLTDLTAWIGPVSQERLEQAIARCDLPLMRSLAGPHKGFFRSGSVGEWQTLPPGVLELFGRPPYKQQFSELGYTLECGSETRALSIDNPGRNPFHKLARFSNGVTVSPILIDFYLSLDPQQNRSWPPVASAGPHSFLQWCNGSAALTGAGAYAKVPLSNLAHYLYRSRRDLQRAFPDLRGADRANYAEWFIRNHNLEYGLDAFFSVPVRQHFLEWGNARHPADRVRGPWRPKLTNFAMHVYESSPELRSWFRDIQCEDRWKFLEWILRTDHGLPIFPELAESIRADLERRRGFHRLRDALHQIARRFSYRSFH